MVNAMDGVSSTSFSDASLEAQRHLLDMSLGLLRSRVLHAAAELGLADYLAAGPATCADLAARANSDADALYRLLRALAAMGVFEELGDRRFALNVGATPLLSDAPGSVRDLVRYLGADWNMRSLALLPQGVRSGESAFHLAHGMPLFDYLTGHDEDARLFDAALARFSLGMAEPILSSLDLSNCSRIVDVGGGNGRVLCGLLRRHAALTGVLFDRQGVIEAARADIRRSDVNGRIELVAGDFFEAVPAGADVYLLKNVIHDWPADQAAQILANCRAAMGEGGRVLLVEIPLDAANEGEFAKLMDVGMLATTGGRERTTQEYAELCNRAGLRTVRVLPTKSPFCIVEAVAAQDTRRAP